MGIGASLFLVAAGAVLAWAVEVETEGVDLGMIGVILMVVGAIGLLFTLLFWSSAPWRRTIVEDDVPARRRRVYEYEDI